MRWFTRGGLMRLAVLALVLGGLVLWGWSVMVRMPGSSYRGPLPPLTGAESAIRDALRGHVELLAGRIGERNLYHPGKFAAAAEAIEGQLAALGYQVRSEEFQADGKPCRNLSVEVPGTERPEEVVVIGAHYDSVQGCPGANDNGSGVAAVLELARALAGKPARRTVRFVAFANEEAPFFGTERMGSLVAALGSRARGERVTAMLSLETLGYYKDEPGTQGYPWPFSLFYPDTGNFIGFVGNLKSRDLVRHAIRSFRETTRFPSEGAAVFEWVKGASWSDHWAFWQAGYPAIMLTDTAPFRYPHYHTPEDTPDKLDYDRLARVVAGLIRVARSLAGS
jgi:hypothetical protein